MCSDKGSTYFPVAFKTLSGRPAVISNRCLPRENPVLSHWATDTVLHSLTHSLTHSGPVHTDAFLFEKALICVRFALPSTLICSKTLSVFIENLSFWKRCWKWIVLKTLRHPYRYVLRKRIVYKTMTSLLRLASTPAVIQNGGWNQRSVVSVEFDRVFTV